MKEAILGQRIYQREFAIWAAILHIGALILLPIYFSWANLALGFGLAVVTAYSMGIFHHMYFSHASFKAHPLVGKLGALLGTLTWRGPMASPIRYVALHRIHHRYSDQEFDPHSPIHGVFHAILGWNWNFSRVFSDRSQYYRLSGRVANDAWLVTLDKNVHLIQALWGIALFAIGGSLGFAINGTFNLRMAIGWMVYGVFAKSIIVVYLANLVDVINHRVGYRNYDTKDQSTNSFLMAAVHLGGAVSWHNNHHARPGYFMVKKNWWEIDFYAMVLRALSTFGLVSDVRVLDESKSTEPLRLIDFLQQSRLRAGLMIANRLMQVVLGLTLATLAFDSNLQPVLKVMASVFPLTLAAIGFHNLALIGHEGTHFNLAKGKMRSSILGTFLSSITPLHFNTGFAVSHSQHHLFTNTEKDPDLHVFTKYRNGISRLLLSRRAASLRYLKLTLDAAFASESKIQIAGLSPAQTSRLAKLNLVLSASFLLSEIALAFFFGSGFLFALALSFAGTYFLSAVRPYLEHAGTDEKRMTNSRTFRSHALDFVFGTINYHLAHHLHPRVPAYRLPALHRWLVANQTIDESAIVKENSICKLIRIIDNEPYGSSLLGAAL